MLLLRKAAVPLTSPGVSAARKPHPSTLRDPTTNAGAILLV
jgi:hypothetical protein